ncbi:MAG: shikimate dehydrogenase [Chloroflexi bacterium]|nr:shikimate dehydrogenase [Chloroflexota bacterium]
MSTRSHPRLPSWDQAPERRKGRGSSFVVGLIGYPLRHSVSPAFQQAAFDFHHLPITYQAWETPREQLDAVPRRVREPDCLGINVTIPYKQVVLSWLDAVDGLAEKIGAVNTIVNERGKLRGFNTDAEGFLRGLREEGSFEPAEKRVVVLGAGGAARAVVFALASAEAAAVSVFNRTPDRAEALVAAVRERMPGVRIAALPWDERLLGQRLGECDLLVNTTPVGMSAAGSGMGAAGSGMSAAGSGMAAAGSGMAAAGSGMAAAGSGIGHGYKDESPLPERLVPSEAFVYDLVYNPAETRLLRLARAKGARTLGGLPMLIHQGAAAFELWTGRPAPRGLMLQRAEEALLR